MYKGGYSGKILRVNLTDQTAKEEELPKDVAKDFIRRWLDRDPNDEQFRALYNDIDHVLDKEFGIVTEGKESREKGEK